MSVALDILRTYRAPARILRKRVAAGASEARAFAVLLAGCVLMFAAQWPRLSREAFLDPTVPFEARVGGALLGWLFIAPLAFYVVAGVAHLAARLVGGTATGLEARMALFWAVLAASPLWLLNGLFAGFIGPGPVTTASGLLASAAFLVFWGRGLWAVGSRAGRAA